MPGNDHPRGFFRNISAVNSKCLPHLAPHPVPRYRAFFFFAADDHRKKGPLALESRIDLCGRKKAGQKMFTAQQKTFIQNVPDLIVFPKP